MAEESKPKDPPTSSPEAADTPSSLAAQIAASVESDSDSGPEDGSEQAPGAAATGSAADATQQQQQQQQQKKKKKKSKRQKLKEALAGRSQGDIQKALGSLTPQQVSELVQLNPALAQEIGVEGSSSGGGGGGSSSAAAAEGGAASSSSASGGAGHASAVEALKRLNLEDIMTGLASSGRNVKDMASYKFWSTQPVMKFGEPPAEKVEEGPLKVQRIEDIPTAPAPLGIQGFEWVTVDLTDEAQLKEVYELLNGHYVEDTEAMFRFKYSPSILKWALMPPGWKKQWHIGIRGGRSLCAFISAVPVQIRVRDKVINGSEVNFMVVHKKLRNRRLAPVLIKEITRLCNLEGVWQAIHTAGIVLPKPVSTCRYYHRAINWQKLYEVGFSPLPPNSKPLYQIRKYALPDQTSTRGLREMQPKDLPAVYDLLKRYLHMFDLAPEYGREELEHWLLNPKNKDDEQVIWSYVVEDANKKITDFFSFYCLESSVIGNPKHQVVRAAYLYYYATETALTTPFDKPATKARLNALINDALILAKRYKFDVFNALSLMHNGLFLEQQKFGPGDGQLHYYLFNYRANPIAGGVDKRNRIDEEHLSGVGFVML